MINPYWWLSEEEWQWCLRAQEDWARRLPAINAGALRTREKWFIETENKARWAQCDW